MAAQIPNPPIISHEQQQLRPEQIQLHPQLKDYFPLSTIAEAERLEERILHEGRVRDKLLLWQSSEGEYFVLDGHRRLEVLLKHPEKGIKWEYEVVGQFENLEQLRWEMLNLQMERRNLTTFMLAYYRGRTYMEMKKDPFRPRGKQEATGKTKYLLAEEFKVSAATIERDAAFYKGVNRFADLYWNGSKVSEKDKILRKESIFSKGDLEIIGKLNELDPKLLYRYKQLIGNFEDLLKLDAGERYNFLKEYCEHFKHLSDEEQSEAFEKVKDMCREPWTQDPERRKSEIKQLFERAAVPPLIRHFEKWVEKQSRQIGHILKGKSKGSLENKRQELEECVEKIRDLIQSIGSVPVC
jgi:hypothetical protein